MESFGSLKWTGLLEFYQSLVSVSGGTREVEPNLRRALSNFWNLENPASLFGIGTKIEALHQTEILDSIKSLLSDRFWPKAACRFRDFGEV